MKAIQMINKGKQQGFTIIELVVVILLLGILAATALPRFMNVADQAHDSVVDAVQGGLATGVALARAQWFAEGQPATLGGQSDYAGLGMNNNGYPNLVSYNGSPTGPGDGSDFCIGIYNELLQSGRPLAASVDQQASFNPAGGGMVEVSYGSVGAGDVAGAAQAVSFVAVLDIASVNPDTYFCDSADGVTCDDPNDLYTGGNPANTYELEPGTSCIYYYVGQFKEVGAAEPIPTLALDLNTGEVSRGTFVL